MKRRERFFALMLGLLLTVGCAKPAGDGPSSSAPSASEPSAQEGPQSFALAYSREDTLNPYSAQTEANLNLAGLLFDSLTVIDDRFSPVCSLAAEVQFSDATHLVARLREGACFSDGTAVTGADVVFSFQLAKASANYKALLTHVTAVSLDRKSGALTFTLSATDPNGTACLSFPVIQKASATSAAGEAPLGGGLYRLKNENGTATLERNPYCGKTAKYTTVLLHHLPNAERMYYGLKSGNITYYYDDLESGQIPRVSGASAAVNMNALVYLGVNSGREGLADARVRQALSRLIDRKALAASACSGWAVAASAPFHPAWAPMQELKSAVSGRDLSGAVELLEAAGYGTTSRELKTLSVELIYSTSSGSRSAAAEQIRSELEGAGIRVTVTPLDYAEYKNRLAAGKYDLYIGEIRLTATMDLTPLLGAGGAAAFGVKTDGAGATAYRQYCEGAQSLEEFVAAFGEDLPYIPLCWRSGFAAFDRRLSTVTPHGFSPFYGMESWK